MIKKFKNSKTLQKVIVWRLISVSITLTVMYIATGSLKETSGLTLVLQGLLVASHLTFEKLWEKKKMTKKITLSNLDNKDGGWRFFLCQEDEEVLEFFYSPTKSYNKASPGMLYVYDIMDFERISAKSLKDAIAQAKEVYYECNRN